MKILLAVDGSSGSDDAVKEVAQRPWPNPSTVCIICVIRPFVPPANEFVLAAATMVDIRQQQTRAAEQLTTKARELLAAPGLSVQTTIREGDPRTEIVSEADDWTADLIVVGSHGRTGLQRMVLGGVAQSVVAHAHCSVEVVRRRKLA